MKNAWNKSKFRAFVYSHLLLLLALVVLPLDRYYLYDLLVFSFVTSPLIRLVQHEYFAHSYVRFRNRFVKFLMFSYFSLYSFWKLEDTKNYHIAHHKSWLTEKDTTAREVRQGWFRYLLGLSDPAPMDVKVNERDPDVIFFNGYFYPIKIILLILIYLCFGLTFLIHFVLIQQWMIYVTGRFHDIMFHYKDSAKDQPLTWLIYGNDSWHITHHSDFSSPTWIAYDPQRLYRFLMCSDRS